MHHHHHASPSVRSLDRAFVIGIAINIAFIAVEAVIGFWQSSMGLLADAGHNLGDVASLALSLIAIKLYQKAATKKFTYGFMKSTILASFINAVILLVAVGGIVVESINQLINPKPLEGLTVAAVAGIGVIVNGVTAYLFADHKDKDLNVKGSYIHMAMDALVSLGVVVAGIVIHYTGWYIIDPIIGFVIAIVIVKFTWGLLSDSVRLSIDGVPEGIDIENVEKCILDTEGVESFHHLHIWALSTTDNALTVHVVLQDIKAMENVKFNLKESLKQCGINHATIEFELEECQCKDS